MNLGLFNFRNDDVLLLSASSKEMLSFAKDMQKFIDSNDSTFAVHERLNVSSKKAVKLFASSSCSGGGSRDEFWWKCTAKTVREIVKITEGEGEKYFDVQGLSSLLLVTCSSHYNDDWWSDYG